MINIINEEIITDEHGVQWEIKTISTGKQTAVIKTRISTEEEMNQPVMPTIEEMQMQTLLNTEYLVIISEITNM